MRKLILAAVLLPLVSGAALARGPGGNGGHGGPAHGGSGPSYGEPGDGGYGPLADSDWRVQWVQQHEQAAPVAGPALPQQAPAT
jgi:hypothetical protein